MNHIQLPVAIRTTAAALAVFMTIATLNSLSMAAEPQHSALMAATAARHATAMASVPRVAQVVAQGPMAEFDH